MPKMKTHSSAKKRFKVTGSGKVKFKKPKTSHMMMNKPKSMKRKAKNPTIMATMDAVKVLVNYMPYLSKNKKHNPSPSPAENAVLKEAKKAARAAAKGGK